MLSGGYLIITDVAFPFKPIHLLDDDPSEFSLYFESGAEVRRCYLAPERLLARGDHRSGSSRVASSLADSMGTGSTFPLISSLASAAERQEFVENQPALFEKMAR